MKKTQKASAIALIANRAALVLWETAQNVFALSHEIVDLVTACDCDLSAAGEAFGVEWAKMSGEVEGGLTTALLTEACLLACLDRKECGQFIRATGVVSRQQAHKKGQEIYEGKKAKKKAKGAKNAKAETPETAAPKTVSFESLESDIKSLPKGALTKVQAMALAKLIAAAV